MNTLKYIVLDKHVFVTNNRSFTTFMYIDSFQTLLNLTPAPVFTNALLETLDKNTGGKEDIHSSVLKPQTYE